MTDIILICILIPVSVGNCQIVLGREYGAFDDNVQYSTVDEHGAAEFGLADVGLSHNANCGQSIRSRDGLKNLCVANLFSQSGLPEIIDDTNNIGYHTVFELSLLDTSFRSVPVNVRFIAESERNFQESPNNYVIAVSEDFFLKYLSYADPSDRFSPYFEFTMSSDFFTDFKVNVSSDQDTDIQCSNSRSDNLSVYFSLTDSNNCGRQYVGYFGIRFKPDGLKRVFETVRISVTPRGSYGSVGKKKDHFYHIDPGDLGPLLKAADCRIICKHKITGKSHCKRTILCGAEFNTINYNGTQIFTDLLADYAYLRLSVRSICAELRNGNNHAYATSSVIFDETLGGQPSCDCAKGYGWNTKAQACETCNNDLHGCIASSAPATPFTCNSGDVWDHETETCVNAEPMLCVC